MGGPRSINSLSCLSKPKTLSPDYHSFPHLKQNVDLHREAHTTRQKYLIDEKIGARFFPRTAFCGKFMRVIDNVTKSG